MESLFARSHPFEEDPLGNAFYYPTQPKDIGFDDQKTCFTPKTTNQSLRNGGKNIFEATEFLTKSNSLRKDEIPTKECGLPLQNLSGSSKYDESWPSTIDNADSGNPLIISEDNHHKHVNDWLNQKKADSTRDPKGTIARYIDRFRNQPPKSREERDQTTLLSDSKSGEFWWVSALPSSSSTPKESDASYSPPVRLRDTTQYSKKPPVSPEHREQSRTRKHVVNKQINDHQSSVSSLKHEATDSDTTRIQRRAQKLIEMSESTLTSSSSDKQGTLKQGTPSKIQKDTRIESGPRVPALPFSHTTPSSSISALTSPRPKPAPEDDILYQWRLARKMEKARSGGNVFSKYPRVTQSEIGSSGLISNVKDSMQPVCTEAKLKHTKPGLVDDDTTKMNCADQASGPAFTPTAAQTEEQIKEENSSHDIDDDTQKLNSDDQASGPDIMSTAAQTLSIYSHPVTLENVNVELSTVSSHMHTMCDILPCPHQKLSADERRSCSLSQSVCPKQSELTNESSKTSPIQLSAPVLGLDIGQSSHFATLGDEKSISGFVDSAHAHLGKNAAAVIQSSCQSLKKNDSIRVNNDADSKKYFQSTRERIEPQSDKNTATFKGKNADTFNDITLPGSMPIEGFSSNSKHKSTESGLNSNEASIDIESRDPNTGKQIISNAINQVVSENLFTASLSDESSTQAESIQTIDQPEAEAIDAARNLHVIKDGDHDEKTTNEFSEDFIDQELSDEEYPDDEILKILRLRKEGYTKTLREIEAVLSEYPEK